MLCNIERSKPLPIRPLHLPLLSKTGVTMWTVIFPDVFEYTAFPVMKFPGFPLMAGKKYSRSETFACFPSDVTKLPFISA